MIVIQIKGGIAMLFKDYEKEVLQQTNSGNTVPLFEQIFLTEDIGELSQIIQLMNFGQNRPEEPVTAVED